MTGNGEVAVYPHPRKARRGMILGGASAVLLLAWSIVFGSLWAIPIWLALALFTFYAIGRGREKLREGKPALVIHRNGIDAGGYFVPWHEVKSASSRFEWGPGLNRGRLIELELQNPDYEPPDTDRELASGWVQPGESWVDDGRLEIPVSGFDRSHKELLELIREHSGGAVAIG